MLQKENGAIENANSMEVTELRVSMANCHPQYSMILVMEIPDYFSYSHGMLNLITFWG